ncbi:Macrophage mannose receptor 1 [Holothuria leucospilota]|uniref:Macrophage mannose receptor 1 n=1 Tax=Holothuria leucospilota TaxID=206669 RepID=A0A9Q1H514_HOLLE|nr:Macrophage mannose receptor 1 [Holothuria leucospilota]
MLGCCLISETDAYCETPPTFLNAYVQWGLGSAVESSVIYSCNDGYEMSGPADHVVLSCNQEEEWTGPDIDCTEKISCSLPPSPAFGSYTLTESGLVFQSSVSFHCQAGYTLDGPENITCTASGEWNKAEGEEYVEPICKRSCTQENYRYQFHECYERMDRTGNWDFANTSCGNEGGQLAIMKDSTRQSFIENILKDDTTHIYWIGGYELDRDWKYPSDGQYATYFNWAPTEPNSSDERCVYLSNVNGPENSLKWNDEYCSKSIVDTDPKVPIYCICETDGNCSSLSTAYNKYQYEYRCLSFLNDAKRNQSSSKIKCSNDLRGKLVEIKSQDMQDFIENVINSNGYETANWWIGLEEGFNRTWSWVDGERIESFFWAEGEPSNSNENCLDILTDKEYKWNDDGCSNTNRKYICQHGEPKCGNPGIPFHGNMTIVKESYSVGDTVYFSCNDGYVLSNRLMERLTCQNDSTWSGPVPSCQKINCSDPVPDIPNATSTPVSTVYRGISVYKCLDGNYSLNGYPVSVCQEDGTWSSPNFTCTGKITEHASISFPFTLPFSSSSGDSKEVR